MKLKAGNTYLVIDERKGGLLSLCNEKGTEFLSENKLPLFTFSYIEKGERRKFTADDFMKCKIEKIENGVQLMYMGFRDLEVIAIISQRENSFGFTLSLRNLGGVNIEWVNYPNLLLKDSFKEGYRALLPMFEGVEISDFRLRKMYFPYEELKYPSGGWDGEYPGSAALQLLAYYNGQEGIYFCSEDKNYQLKQIDCEDREEGLYFVNRLFGIGKQESFNYGYDLDLHAYSGGYYEALDYYRDFVEKSGQISIPKLKEDTSLPLWTKNCPIVVVYAIRGERDTGTMAEQECYYPYTNALPILESLKEKLNSELMVLLAHWEGTAPWAPPYVWPPYGDEENFRLYTEKLHEMGCHFGVYCSGLGWTTKSVIWQPYDKCNDYEHGNFSKIMCVDVGENHQESKICRGAIRFGYDMCIAEEQTKQIVIDQVQSIAEGCQVDYIQFFDQNIGGIPCLCYSEKHAHPSIPGKWLIEDQQKLIDRMYDAVGKDILLGCEGAASEALFGKLRFNDARNYMGFPIGQPRPMFDYVYHEYISNFMGNQNTVSCYVFTDEAPEIIFYKTAYFFAQGNILTVVLGRDGKLHWDWGTPWESKPVDHEAYAAFVKELNAWRKHSLYEELQYGRMIKPLDIECGEYVVPTYELYYPLFEGTTYYGNHRFYPSIITNAYETQEGVTQIFVNFSYKTQRFSVKFPEEKTIKIFTDKQDEKGTQMTVKGDLKLEFSPRSVMKITWGKEK